MVWVKKRLLGVEACSSGAHCFADAGAFGVGACGAWGFAVAGVAGVGGWGSAWLPGDGAVLAFAGAFAGAVLAGAFGGGLGHGVDCVRQLVVSQFLFLGVVGGFGVVTVRGWVGWGWEHSPPFRGG